MNRRLRMTESGLPPVFIIGAARTGSTLLRYLINAHPDVYCPAETNLTQVFKEVFFSHSVASGSPHTEEIWQPAAVDTCQCVADDILGAAARRAGKGRWCDKSLITIEQVNLVRAVYPKSPVLSLFRRCVDVVLSAMEACPWGVSGYGFDPFVRETPNNDVLGLVRYWIDRVERQLVAEHDAPERFMRLTYEQMVSNPEETMRDVCVFLDLDYDPRYFRNERVFAVPATIGPEDYKINYTTCVHQDSVGRGIHLPIENLVPPELITRVAELERECGIDASPADNRSEGQLVNSLTLRIRSSQALVERMLTTYGRDRIAAIAGEKYPFTVRLRLEDRDSYAEIPVVDGELRADADGDALTIKIGCEVLLALVEGVVTPADVARRTLLPVTEADGKPPSDQAAAYAAVRTFLRLVAETRDLVADDQVLTAVANM
jgi:hypothetical protein